MWLAKWFGRRGEATENDEPARHAAPEISKAVQPLTGSKPRAAGKPEACSQTKKGFDPYNSGAFERGAAWERVNRRLNYPDRADLRSARIPPDLTSCLLRTAAPRRRAILRYVKSQRVLGVSPMSLRSASHVKDSYTRNA